MKKQNIINLVKYHTEHNNAAFVSEVSEIAREFDANGDYEVAQYLMDLVSNANVYIPQANYRNLQFLEKLEYSSNPLMLPNVIEEDVIGIARAIKNKAGMSKFLFYGAPGTGKYCLSQLAHSKSSRSAYRFLFANCNSDEEDGHVIWGEAEKDSFRNNLKSMFSEAEKGTLYFHEIEKLDYEAQEILGAAA